MGVTRRGFTKGALATGVLAVLQPPFKLPQISGVAPKSYADAVRATNPIVYEPLDEKESDREQADKILAALGDVI